MGIMKALLDQRLEENKYEMWEAPQRWQELREKDTIDEYEMLDCFVQTKKLLAKIEELPDAKL